MFTIRQYNFKLSGIERKSVKNAAQALSLATVSWQKISQHLKKKKGGG